MQLLVNIDVDDLDRATAFYTRCLGLSLGRRLGADIRELVGLAVPIYLIAKPAGSLPHAGATAGRTYARHWTPVHLDVAVDDLDAAVARALAAGAIQETPIAAEAWGSIATLSDPFGNGFCLLQFTARGYDAITS